MRPSAGFLAFGYGFQRQKVRIRRAPRAAGYGLRGHNLATAATATTAASAGGEEKQAGREQAQHQQATKIE